MNAEQLRDAIWKIDDKYIAEAETYEPETKSRKPIWMITSASAAVIALCTCVHFHNEVERARHPEIDNSIVVTTAETNSQTEEVSTEMSEYYGKITEILKPVCTDDMVYTSETAACQTDEPENTTEKVKKTVSQDEKPVVTQLLPETKKTETAAPVTENPPATEANGETSVTKLIATPDTPSVPVTDFTAVQITDYPIETQSTGMVMTEKPFTEPVFVPVPAWVQTYPIETYPAPKPEEESEITCDTTSICETSHNEVRIKDFPKYLMTSDGVWYDRAEIIPSDKVGQFIKQDVVKDVYDNTYTVNVYLLDGFYGDTIRVIYFDNKNCYVSYAKDKNN